MTKLNKSLLDLIRYLESNSDSMPDYGRRSRTGARISTGFVESAVNEIIAKRMVKKQQMRWNRYTVQHIIDVRIHVLTETLEDALRHWHRGFRPVANPRERASRLDLPRTLHALLSVLYRPFSDAAPNFPKSFSR